MEIECGDWADGVIRIMRVFLMDQMAQVVLADLKRYGILPVFAVIFVYRLLLEALLYKRLLRPIFHSKAGRG